MAQTGSLIVQFWNRITSVVGWLCGCSHRRTTFPMTARNDDLTVDSKIPPKATYVVCLECGRHIAYDWTTNRPDSRKVSAQERPKRRD
ncbi:hypothetical protein [Paludibaculum fermentans]|uniref:hypothetical protein n=1 Tax=Paludibaculum fermentans TaxID=1473598 RepID=UPI003EB7D9D2